MDFQLLSDQPESVSIFDRMEALFSNRKRFWQSSLSHPPLLLGLMVLLIAAFEIALALAILKGEGSYIALLKSGMWIGFIMLAAEVFVAAVATQGGELLGKKGSSHALITFFSLGMAPFLLFLPFAFLFRFGEFSGLLITFVFFLSLFKTLGLWREGLELTYKFSRIQSALVLYAATSIAFMGFVVLGYFLLLGQIATFAF